MNKSNGKTSTGMNGRALNDESGSKKENRKEKEHTEGGERLTEGKGSMYYEKGNNGNSDLTSITRGIKEVEAHRKTTRRRKKQGKKSIKKRLDANPYKQEEK